MTAQKSWDQFDEDATQRHANITLGKIQVKLPHQRSPYALNFQDKSQEETERRCARGDTWRLAKRVLKLKEKDKTTFFSLPTKGLSQRHPK